MEFACRACRSRAGEVVLDLGHQPSWDRMPPADAPLPDPVHPLRMWFCRDCGLAQLRDDVEGVEELPGVEPQAVLEQTDAAVERMAELGLLRPGARVAEFGSPHGESWLPRLAARRLVPVEDGGPADLVLDVYGLLHEPDQAAALRERAAAVAPGGALVLQLLSLATVLRHGQWYDLRHGHHAYWSLPALERALRGHGLGVHRARRYPLAGGTLLLVATRAPQPDDEVRALLADEERVGATDPARLRSLQDAAGSADALRGWLRAERAAGRTVVGYPAASRAVPVVSRAALDRSLLAAVGDASPAKQGRRMPGTEVPVIAPGDVLALRPDRVVVFLPEIADEVRRALPEVEASGGRWVVLDPSPRVLAPVTAEPASR